MQWGFLLSCVIGAMANKIQRVHNRNKFEITASRLRSKLANSSLLIFADYNLTKLTGSTNCVTRRLFLPNLFRFSAMVDPHVSAQL